jgi:hypothetical protein
MWKRLYNWIKKHFGVSDEPQKDVDIQESSRRKSVFIDPAQSPIAPLSGDLIRMVDYLVKMLPEDRFDCPVLLDIISPTEISDMPPEQVLDTMLGRLNDKGLSIKFPNPPTSVEGIETIEGNNALLELTSENTIVIRLHEGLLEHKAALHSIMALELSRFLIEHNEINYSIHSSENLQLPDITLHILGLSDVFIHGLEDANFIWPQYFKRPIFSRLRFQQHRSLIYYLENLNEMRSSRNQSTLLSIAEMEQQLFQYMKKDWGIVKKEFERTQKAHPHFSQKDIYEKMLYEWKREFKI